jgi:hypothetical protein
MYKRQQSQITIYKEIEVGGKIEKTGFCPKIRPDQANQ